MQEILQDIQTIQNYLHGGYKDEVSTNHQWLDVSEMKFCQFLNSTKDEVVNKFQIF